MMPFQTLGVSQKASYSVVGIILGDCIVILIMSPSCMIPSSGSAFYNSKDDYNEKHYSLVFKLWYKMVRLYNNFVIL